MIDVTSVAINEEANEVIIKGVDLSPFPSQFISKL